MKASEQRLVVILIVLVALFCTGFMSMRMLAWQGALDKRARSVELWHSFVKFGAFTAIDGYDEDRARIPLPFCKDHGAAPV